MDSVRCSSIKITESPMGNNLVNRSAKPSTLHPLCLQIPGAQSLQIKTSRVKLSCSATSTNVTHTICTSDGSVIGTVSFRNLISLTHRLCTAPLARRDPNPAVRMTLLGVVLGRGLQHQKSPVMQLAEICLCWPSLQACHLAPNLEGR